MADFSTRVPENVPGRFYVDESCIFCDYCVEVAPTVFREIKERGVAAVFYQPSTAEELALTLEALEGCPTESIGSDGGDSV